MNEIASNLQPGDALIVVDVQVDFCPGGALPIDGGDAVVPVLNRWLAAAAGRRVPVYASRCWHPESHVSFETRGGPWPRHCVQDTDGARLHPALELPADAVIVTKGVRFDQDQNSAFDQTGLDTELRARGIRRLWVGGLAQDVCVAATVIDGCRHGFDVRVIEAATRPVTADGGRDALARMREAGATIV